ncbi:UDP-N-acetylmuramate dehydrogenase [Butyrivibrio sp. INlla16]|uniref:UDP-N-acetylmuramate dehydrogenase n=1 Tax=Butyrivibrio sp. INlla16 TaxID=1520807 RepID=UPI00088112C0|nr:UDP-N-acetylmuramate dehydrogenase [Butyrivibrio sp. INlla16]SDB59694.1 UDP-N-acetylmuramate dehydrogenase [Butyrivibrio sp. INlla16]
MKIDLDVKLSEIIPKQNIIKNEIMSRHTTFRTGGPADYFVKVGTKEALSKLIKLFHEEGLTFSKDYYILGNGSNLLVSDEGYRGIILSLEGEFAEVVPESDTVIRAGAAALNVAVANLARDKELKGFEFAHGIPGSIGGALVMNAGAYGGEMKQVVRSVTAIMEDGTEKIFSRDELEFDYRTSVFKRINCVITDALIELEKGNRADIEALMEDLKNRRISKQPLEYPSAGSTFKRPEGYFAGKLIEDAGLKGYSVGGAQVSEKHSGFVINTGDATSDDVYKLICDVRKKVMESFGVELSPEVILLGEFKA